MLENVHHKYAVGQRLTIKRCRHGGVVCVKFTYSRNNRTYTFHWFNTLYTGGPFHGHVLDASTCQVRDVGSILSVLFCV